MEPFSRFNFTLLKKTFFCLFFPDSFTYICCFGYMEYLSGRVAVAAWNIHIWSTEITFPTRNHTMQHFIFLNAFFSKDFTGFSAENFNLINVSTPEIFLHIFHDKLHLFIILITKVTFTKQYHTSWHKWIIVAIEN